MKPFVRNVAEHISTINHFTKNFPYQLLIILWRINNVIKIIVSYHTFITHREQLETSMQSVIQVPI